MSAENYPIVEYLVSKGLDINQKNERGKTPILNNQVNLFIVKKLEQLGADLTVKDNDENNLLHIVCEKWRTDADDVELAKYLIDEKGFDINETNDRGESPLFLALGNNTTSVLASFLIERGADINLKDKREKSLLHKAAENGSLMFVKELIEKGCDLLEKNSSGKTILHFAVESGDMTLLKYLVEELNLDVTVTDDSSNNLLVTAAEGGSKSANATMFSYLVSKGVDANSKNSTGENAMFTAVSRGIEVVKLLANAGCEIKYVNESGQTPLFNAVSSGDLDVIRFVLDSGVDVTAKAQWTGKSAVWEALSGWSINETSALEILNEFVKRDVDLSREHDSDSRNLLWVAGEKGLMEVIKFLCDKGANHTQVDTSGQNVLWGCAEANINDADVAVKTMTFFVEKGVNINHRNHEGQTVLFKVVENLNKDALNYLLTNNLNINQADNQGRTPLLYLMEQLSSWKKDEQVELVKLLIEKGASVNVRTTEGRTPLFGAASEGLMDVMQACVDAGVVVSEEKEVLNTAIEHNQKEAVEWLIAHGADVAAVDGLGRGPIFAAAQEGSSDILELLIKKGVSVEAKSLLGETPLMAAAESTKSGALDCVKLLAQASKTLINRKNNDGKSALILALINDKEDIVKILVENGADINTADNKKMTPLHHAAKKGNEELVKLFLEKGAKKGAKDKKNRTPFMVAVGNAHMDLSELLQ